MGRDNFGKADRPRGLVEMCVSLNAPYIGIWAEKIGQFILNFGAVELLSYQHLLLLEASRRDFDQNVGRPLSHRIARIQKLLPRSA